MISSDEYKKIPAVDLLLNNPTIKKLLADYNQDFIKSIVREVLDNQREKASAGKKVDSHKQICDEITKRVTNILEPSLKSVINATGILLHTNLGRAKLGEYILEKISPIITGYSNLEFDLSSGKRGERNIHISSLIRYITGAEDTIVVNNNAAGVYFVLHHFASDLEVIISRSELIEIGGSFRIPDIITTSGAVMREVGTTNRTYLRDYENAMSSKTKIILKAHRSNYHISGFTAEPTLSELSDLAHKNNCLLVYDLGSGLLRRPDRLNLADEPDIKSALNSGADIVMFSGDKLLGGPQAGIICGKSEYIGKLAKSPLMRVLRVGKLTIAALQAAMVCYLSDKNLDRLPFFSYLNRDKDELLRLSKLFQSRLEKHGIDSEIIQSDAFTGGGTLPGHSIPSIALRLNDNQNAEEIHHKLMQGSNPIVSILRKGEILFDMFCLTESDIDIIAAKISDLIK